MDLGNLSLSSHQAKGEDEESIGGNVAAEVSMNTHDLVEVIVHEWARRTVHKSVRAYARCRQQMTEGEQ